MSERKTTRRSALQATAIAGVSVLAPRLSAAPSAHDVPWLAEIQQPPATLPADAPQLGDLLLCDRGQRIATLNGWKPRREEIRRWWLDFLGPMPAVRKAAPMLTVLEEDRPDGVIRQLVRYEVEPGMTTEAYLLKPEKLSGKAPGI